MRKGQAIKSRDRGATWWFLLARVLLDGAGLGRRDRTRPGV